MITIIQKGFFTTIQDEGRLGYRAYGVPLAGAMDRYSYRVANLLVGNEKNEAAIEMTGVGACFKFDEEQYIAICGADMQAKLNGKPIASWSSLLVPKGSELSFAEAITGYRAYLAIRGGFNAPLVLQSRSTYTEAKIGGYEGRILKNGDVLYVREKLSRQTTLQKLPAPYVRQYPAEIVLRVLLGPQDDLFTDKSLETFFTGFFHVTAQSDRSGYWLNGPKIMTISGKTDIISDAVSLGAIQILSSGMPYIVTADHQTTRGFAKIGYVIQPDLALLAQAKAGDRIRFILVTEREAVEALRWEQQTYCDIFAALDLQKN